MLTQIINYFISRGERQIGVKLDYARKIASLNIGLFLRYAKIFGFLDPNKHVPPLAYHTARICGALSADCGTCVEAEINLAQQAGMDGTTISHLLSQSFDQLPDELMPVAELATSVTNSRDDPSARKAIVQRYGESGLTELAYAMNGAALLPGIKRAMGYATLCYVERLRQRATDE